jgi:hypothetical protein
METRKPDQMMPSTPDTIAAKKPSQTPRLTCETDANSAQKISAVGESATGPYGSS